LKTGEVLEVTGFLRNREKDTAEENWKLPLQFLTFPLCFPITGVLTVAKGRELPCWAQITEL